MNENELKIVEALQEMNDYIDSEIVNIKQGFCKHSKQSVIEFLQELLQEFKENTQ